jgi:hypothetical protein
MVADVLDLREVRGRGGRIVEIAQRDPARHEKALNPGVFLARLGGVGHRLIGGLGVTAVEQLARHDPPLDPPVLAVVHLIQVTWGG